MNTVWKWENTNMTPSVEVAQKLANFFNVSIEELLNGVKANEWKVNILWEVGNMNGLDIKPNEFAVGFRESGDLMLWGSIPAEKTLDEATGRIRDELAAAMAGKEAYEAKKKSLPAAD